MPVSRKSRTRRRRESRQDRSSQSKQRALPQTCHPSKEEPRRTPEPSLLSRLSLESNQEMMLEGEEWNPSSTTSDPEPLLDMQLSPQSSKSSNPIQNSLGKRKMRPSDYTAPRSTRPRLEESDQVPVNLLSRISSPTKENLARDRKPSLQERLTCSITYQRELEVMNQISKETKREKRTKN